MFARYRRPSGPMWPYVGLLCLLFAMSVTAPRAWAPKPRVAAPRPFERATGRIATAAMSLAFRRTEPTPAPMATQLLRHVGFVKANVRRKLPAGPAEVDARMKAPRITPIGLQDNAAIMASLDALREILSPAKFEAVQVAIDPIPVELTLTVPPDGPADKSSTEGAPDVRIALVPESIDETVDVEPLVEIAAETPAPVAWLTPTSLLARLDALSNECECGAWALRTAQDVEAFAASEPSRLDASVPALAAIWQRLFEGEALVGELSRPEVVTQVRRTCDALRRRLAVWDATLARMELARETSPSAGDASDLGLSLAGVEASLASRNDAQAWREYLLLDQLRSTNEARASLAEDARERLAREVLDRLTSPALDIGQRRLLGERRIQQLAGELRGWSHPELGYIELARGVERFEEALLPSDAQMLASAARQLAASRDPQEQALSLLLNERFRNANIRLEFDAALISRLLPEAPPREQAVHETILGVPSRGHSRTTTRLFFRTANERGRLGLELFAAGDVDSWTTAKSGPARFQNEGRAQFSARRRLRFDRHGLHADQVQIDVASQTALRGVQTDFDRMPLLGRVARNIARNQYQEKRGAAEQEAERRIEEKLSQALMDETETALAAANVRWRERVVAPLDRLGLAPRVIEAGSANDRALVRVRLAADSQLGGHTPRPRLPTGALLALQVHQSALNNILEGMDLNGRSFSLAELGTWLSEKLNRDDLLPKNAMRNDVWVHFADADAVHARLVDGQVELNLHFVELITPHRSWHNFRVRVRYRPESDAFTADLERAGPVELIGDSVSGVELALRGIVNRIFPMDEPWRLVPAQLANNPRLHGLQVTHFVVDDGWLSVAVGEKQGEARSQKLEVRR